jgi:Domain of unknown function (DUF4262)
MKTEDEHSCIDDNRTASHIKEFGLSVIMLEATDYLPSFAYSVGLWQKYEHPEIICFGLPTKTMHPIINDVAEIVKKGQMIETGKIYDQIFQNNRAEFISVDKRNIGDYFAMAINYYTNYDFPALQLIWTDRNDRFPWDADFEKEFVYKQPLLDRNSDFKFREPKNLATYTTRQWLEQNKPILRVVHDNDGDWQFLTGDQMPEDIKIVALEQLIIRDETLNEVFDLEYGEDADREFIGGKWKRGKVEDDQD